MALRVTIDENDFKALVSEIESQEGYRKPIGFGIARVERGQLNPEKILQATFPVINWNENFGSAAILIGALQASDIDVDFTSSLFEDDKPLSPEAVYLKLYALSTGKAPLRSVNLTGAFGVLENVAWSFGQPLELEWLRMHEIEMKLLGEYPLIESVDKFPRFLSHIIPANNTRILDTSKVRMGAQLHAGTTIMPGASYVNFNAGTTGAVMVEGRISSSVVVGRGSDVGGGASILGVLSGTNGNPVSIGENTLLGANSVTGIPLGDGCIVDAGIAILEGTKIGISAAELAKIAEANPKTKLKKAGKEEMVFFKGLELAALHGIHFRQNSVNGMIIATRSKREIKLNSELH